MLAKNAPMITLSICTRSALNRSVGALAAPFSISRAGVRAYTSFFSFGSSASFLTSSLTFCDWLLCASRVASSV